VRPSSFRMAGVAILGAGSWGTALAVHLGRLGRRVALWARRPTVAATLAHERTNAVHLAGVALPPTVVPTAELTEACAGATAIVFACQSTGIRALAGGVDLGQGRPLLVSSPSRKRSNGSSVARRCESMRRLTPSAWRLERR